MVKKSRFVYKEPDTFRTTYEKEQYWDIEEKRWHEGYRGLTGRHYAYLTIGRIKTVTGKIIRPIWRDGDEYIIEEYERSIKLTQDTMVIKRREFGLTSLFGGFEPIYQAITSPGCTSLITSADKTRVQNLFTDKTMVMYNGLDNYIRPNRLSERDSRFLHLAEKDKRTGKITGLDSKIVCRETADSDTNAKCFEAYRARYIFLDELFLHPRPTIVRNSSQSCLMQGFEKKGFMVFGGSCGTEKNSDVEALKKGAYLGQQLWNDSVVLGIRALFIPGWMCIEGAPEIDDNGLPTGKMLSFMENGHSDEKGATEWILKKRSILEKAQDKSPLYNFIKQYPLTIDEVFDINKMGVLPEYVYKKLNIAKKEIMRGENPVMQCDLYRDLDGKVRTKEDKKGSFFILTPQYIEKRKYVSLSFKQSILAFFVHVTIQK